MGIFSESKTYYNSTSVVLFNKAPPLIKQTVVAATIQNRNISKDLITNIANGIGQRVGLLYAYCAAEDNPIGLPEVGFTHISSQYGLYIKAILEKLLLRPVFVSNVVFTTTKGKHKYVVDYYLTDRLGNLTSTVQQWTYLEKTGVYPLLTITPQQLSTPYFPIIPIYVEGAYVAEEGSPLRTSIITACKYINVNPDDIYDSIISNPEHADNPIESAHITLGVEVTVESQIGKQYLHTFFKHMYAASPISKADYYAFINRKNGNTLPPFNRIDIKDSEYVTDLSWLFSEITIVEGNLEKPDGTLATDTYYTSSMVAGASLPTLEDENGYTLYNTSSLSINKQLTATHYQKVTVYGLVHSIIAVGSELRTTLTDAFEPEEGDTPAAFIIPLRRDLINGLGALVRHDLMYDAIRLVVSDRNRVKLKWYQTSAFQVFLTVAAIAISVYSPTTGYSLLTANTLAIATVQVITMRLLMPVALKELEDIVGKELALALMVVAVAYGMGNGVTDAGLAQAGLTTVSGISGIVLSNELKEIQEELVLLKEDIDALEEDAMERQSDILLASKAIRGDTYASMAPDTYVDSFKLKNKAPLLITHTTHSFTDMARFTDRPDSYIRLGHKGY